VYFGRGVASSTVTNYTINGTSGSGSNIAGGGLFFAAGAGTGTGVGGDLKFQIAPVGSTGSSLNSLVTCVTFKSDFSILMGKDSNSDRQFQYSYASGSFSSNGDAQKILFVLRNKTTSATPVVLGMGPTSSVLLTVSSGKLMFCDVLISGIKSDGSSSCCYKRKLAIKNVGGTTSLVGSIETIGTDQEDNVLTDVSITANDTNNSLEISVTGIASETWRWIAVVEGLEIAYGT
jgi:hypothetical protein